MLIISHNRYLIKLLAIILYNRLRIKEIPTCQDFGKSLTSLLSAVSSRLASLDIYHWHTYYPSPTLSLTIVKVFSAMDRTLEAPSANQESIRVGSSVNSR